MLSTSKDAPLIAVSVEVYRFLLAAYPAEFRQEYGGQMVQLFRDCCLRAYRQNKAEGILGVWAVIFLDLIQSLFKEHLQKETNMSKSNFIRVSGWALILAGIAYATIFTVFFLDENYPLVLFGKTEIVEISYFFGLYTGPVFLLLGLLGLRARYGESVGSTGKGILLFGAVFGPFLSLLGILGGDFNLFGDGNGSLWILIITGSALQMLCIAVFGFMAVKSKTLSSMNWLPIAAGGLLPVILFYVYFFGTTLDFNWFGVVTLAFQFLAMIVLGFILQRDVPQEEVLAAA